MTMQTAGNRIADANVRLREFVVPSLNDKKKIQNRGSRSHSVWHSMHQNSFKKKVEKHPFLYLLGLFITP